MCMQTILRLGGVEPLDIQDQADENPNSFGLVQSRKLNRRKSHHFLDVADRRFRHCAKHYRRRPWLPRAGACRLPVSVR